MERSFWEKRVNKKADYSDSLSPSLLSRIVSKSTWRGIEYAFSVIKENYQSYLLFVSRIKKLSPTLLRPPGLAKTKRRCPLLTL